ncbi:MAG: hypothetical protein PHC88_00325 [Terrimicrobiaceae bacterium]|nr:hypothetical protein [Terrimicrobiaceae bacterium]
MIQVILIAFISIWLAWGIINIIRGLGQIVWGLACGIAAIGFYALAYAIEFVLYVARKLR